MTYWKYWKRIGMISAHQTVRFSGKDRVSLVWGTVLATVALAVHGVCKDEGEIRAIALTALAGIGAWFVVFIGLSLFVTPYHFASELGFGDDHCPRQLQRRELLGQALGRAVELHKKLMTTTSITADWRREWNDLILRYREPMGIPLDAAEESRDKAIDYLRAVHDPGTGRFPTREEQLIDVERIIDLLAELVKRAKVVK